ncbi:hypothetical protein AAE478_003689 [Parahypoxylon ruwenzoriense]
MAPDAQSSYNLSIISFIRFPFNTSPRLFTSISSHNPSPSADEAMDVDKYNFFQLLPRILQEAQVARFVAIDVEMTGICNSQYHASYRTSIQDSYSRIKEAAEEFQVLQIGFTFVRFKEETSEYTTSTFNCHVSPLLPRGPFPDSVARYLDRRFGLSARSYSFLQRHKFNLNQALDSGIHYLSREEQRRVMQFCVYKHIDDEHIDPSTLDKESQYFCRYTRKEIDAYVARAHLQAAELRKQQLNREEVSRLSGLQLLFEALSGGSFAARINRDWVHDSRIPGGSNGFNDFNRTFDFQQCEVNLKKTRPILVGHNLFQDLAFIYNTFFEPLPSGVDAFLAKIHELFPRIVDTKYMNTRGKHMMKPDQSLRDLGDFYAKRRFPVISHELDLGYSIARSHHAGFDSSITAVVFLRQTYDLYKRKTHLEKIDERMEPALQQSSLLDNDEDEALEPLRRWAALDPDESASRIAAASRREMGPAPGPEQRKRPGEKYSEREVHMIPLWDSAFWKTYGNKSSVLGAGYISFV